MTIEKHGEGVMFRKFPLAAMVAVAAVLGLSACAQGPFHAAASLRVEVEVYKGPLSKEPEVQWAELKALIREVPNSLTALNDALIVSAAHSGFLPNYDDFFWFIDKPTRLTVQSPQSESNTSGVEANRQTTRVVTGLRLAPVPEPQSTLEVTELQQAPVPEPQPTQEMSEPQQAPVPEPRPTQEMSEQEPAPVVTELQQAEIENDLNLKFGKDPINFCNTYWLKRKLTGFFWELDTYVGCMISAQLHDDIGQLLTQIKIIEDALNPNIIGAESTDRIFESTDRILKVLKGSAEVATMFKIKAIYWAEAHLGAAPQDRLLRINMANFSNTASEFSNQISSRADALLKQMEGTGRPRQELATSVYLRETEPTDFLNLYIWNRAAAPALIEEMILHPLQAFSSEETTDRVRVIERLFADNNWSNINTVYASGQGEVAMALIKDDIGNWNLKSFDNDPSELVEAYTAITIAGLDVLKKSMGDVMTGGASSTALNVISRLTRGQIGSGGATAGGLNVAALHERALARLNDLKDVTEIEDVILKNAVTDAERDAGLTDITARSDAMDAKDRDSVFRPQTDLSAVDSANSPSEMVASTKTAADDAERVAGTERMIAFGMIAEAGQSKAGPHGGAGEMHANTAIELGNLAIERVRAAEESAREAHKLAGDVVITGDEAEEDANKQKAKDALLVAKNAKKLADLVTKLNGAVTTSLIAAKAAVEAERARQELIGKRNAALARARGILGDHAAIIDVLQEGAVDAVPLSGAAPKPAASNNFGGGVSKITENYVGDRG